MKYLLLTCLLTFQLIGHSQTQSKTELVLKLLEVQGSTKTFSVALDNMMDLQKRQFSFIDDEFWVKIEAEFKKDNFKDIFEMLTPIYAKHFSEKQLADIIAFYETETGKRLVEKQPLIISESMQVGAAWGEKIGEQVYEEITATDKFKFNTEFNNCEDFKTGKFKITLPDSSTYEIIRTEHHQTETYNGKTSEYKVEWVANCRFKLVNIGNGSEDNTEELTVNIYETSGNICQTITTMEGVEFFNKAEMIKIE